mmetsp:Transcript_116045/g.248131  ORF Transcript_116045/g.248131 Transcript_116045/m.248131 type:complete len:229 (+) Transcript_116045:33-719(+)
MWTSLSSTASKRSSKASWVLSATCSTRASKARTCLPKAMVAAGIPCKPRDKAFCVSMSGTWSLLSTASKFMGSADPAGNAWMSLQGIDKSGRGVLKSNHAVLMARGLATTPKSGIKGDSKPSSVAASPLAASAEVGASTTTPAPQWSSKAANRRWSCVVSVTKRLRKDSTRVCKASSLACTASARACKPSLLASPKLQRNSERFSSQACPSCSVPFLKLLAESSPRRS